MEHQLPRFARVRLYRNLSDTSHNRISLLTTYPRSYPSTKRSHDENLSCIRKQAIRHASIRCCNGWRGLLME